MSRTDKKQKPIFSGKKDGKQDFKQKIKDMQTWKKVTILVVLIILLAVMIVGIVAYSYMNSLVEKMH